MNKVYFKNVSEIQALANKVFIEQKKRIINLLPYAKIDHIGGTSIPLSLTKGDLDLCVRVPLQSFEDAIGKLRSIYDVNQPENWSDIFASFKDETNLGIDFGLQLVVIDSKSDDFIKLRDVMRKNPKLVKELNEIKVRWQGKSMEEYRKEKATYYQKLRDLYL